jgi:bla regulator protein blaR1
MIPFIADHLWQSTVFAAIAGLLTLAFRKNHARVRHGLWLAASCKFLIPLSLLIALGGRIHWRTATVSTQPGFSIVMDQVSEPFTAPSVSLPPVAPPVPSPLPAVLLAIWGCGFIGISGSWLIRWRRMRASVRAASTVQLELPICTKSSPVLMEPGVFGIFRPVLLLPEGIFGRLTPAQLSTVIEHELCHVRYHDNLVAAIQMFVETVFWFHPLVWFVGKRMIVERERACDEAVLRMGSEPQVYAEAILNVCKLYVGSPLACVAGITGAGLKQRIEDIVRRRTGEGLNRAKKILLATAAVAAVMVPILIGVANSPAMRAQSRSESTPKFEVASIKPCDTGDAGGRKGSAGPTPGRLNVSCSTVQSLIEQAYVSLANAPAPNWHHVEISGIPEWISHDRYSINAKSEAARGHAPPGYSMMGGPMLQGLLEDRFKLKIRREIRQVPVYELTVGKSGPKNLHPAKEGGCIPFDFDNLPPPPKEGVELCEMLGRGVARDATFGSFSEFGVTMPKFAEGLSAILDRNVVDKTRISGKFDINVRIPLDELTPPPPDPLGRPFLRYRDDEMAFAAMRQLGMKLESAKGPGEFLVVEHIERPSAN